MKVKFLGSPEVVGRAAILVSSGGKNIIMDYGVEMTRPPKFPISFPPKDLHALILTHAHLDHIGASPYLYVSWGMPLYLTKPTLELSEVLIKDFIKLSGEYLPYEFIDFTYMAQNAEFVDYRREFKVPGTDFRVEFRDAGHIPGSVQVIVTADNKKILYTSDMNTYETRLQKPADLDFDEEFDMVIIESTYGYKDHPKRSNLEKAFIEKVREVIEDKGTVLVPAFAVARSQEILLVLRSRGFDGKIVMDGMALEVTEILLRNKEFIKSPRSLKKAFGRVKKVRRWRERRKVVKENCVIIAPAGMLGGGAAVFYLSKIYKNPKNGIFLVGYQAPGTPGRTLLEEGVVQVEDVTGKTKAKKYYFEFSSHTDRSGLKEVLSRLSGDPVITIVHGEEEGRLGLKEVAEELGFKTYLPETGDLYVFD